MVRAVGFSLQSLVSTLTPGDAALFKRCYSVLQESLAVSEGGGAPTTSLPKCITSAFLAGGSKRAKGAAAAVAASPDLLGDSPKKSARRKDKGASLSVKTTGFPTLDVDCESAV